MITYETNNEYLMHFNKNHDKLGRFANGHAARINYRGKKKVGKQLYSYAQKRAEAERKGKTDRIKDIESIERDYINKKRKQGYDITNSTLKVISNVPKEKAKTMGKTAAAFAIAGLAAAGTYALTKNKSAAKVAGIVSGSGFSIAAKRSKKKRNISGYRVN